MNALWTRIGLGALGIFTIGMVGVEAVHHAADSVSRKMSSYMPAAHHSTADGPLPTSVEQVAEPMARLAGLKHIVPGSQGSEPREMTFRLDGRKVGTIRRMVIQRTSKGEIPAMNITVDLADDLRTSPLAHCDMLLANENGDGLDEGFRCAYADAPGIVTVGWARFEPDGETRPIAVSAHSSRDLSTGDPFKATIDSDGRVEFMANGKDGGVVQIHADDGTARIRINDGLGKAIFGLLADSTGARLHVRGKNGKDIVRMEASEGGFSLVVDTSAAH